MRENKAKHTVEVGEFNEFRLQEHGAVEQFLHILGVGIEEGNYSRILRFAGKLFCCTELLHCKSYRICMQSDKM